MDNLLVRIHFIVEMIWWTGLAPWEFEFPFPGSPYIFLPSASKLGACIGTYEGPRGVGVFL